MRHQGVRQVDHGKLETLMRRTLAALLGASALVAAFAAPTLAAHGGEPEVVVMQHICNADIQSEADFVAVENEGAGGAEGGEGTLPGLVATVLACPAVVMAGDAPTDGIGAPPTAFDYTLADSDGAAYTASADGMLMAAKLCESDIDLDVDGDGEKSTETCLDVSMYGLSPVAEGEVTITQTAPVGDSRFGTIRFTPASTDDATAVSASNGVIVLDTTQDTTVENPPLPLSEYGDDVAVVHVYNFVNAATTPTTMPNSAVEQASAVGQSVSSVLPFVLLGLLAVAGGAVLAARRISVR